MSQNQPGFPEGYTAHPWSRSVQNSAIYMWDVHKAGHSSTKYPIAPDGEIPNSAIRKLFYPIASDVVPNESHNINKTFDTYSLPDVAALLDQGIPENEIMAQIMPHKATATTSTDPSNDLNAESTEPTKNQTHRVKGSKLKEKHERREINTKTLPVTGFPLQDDQTNVEASVNDTELSINETKPTDPSEYVPPQRKEKRLRINSPPLQDIKIKKERTKKHTPKLDKKTKKGSKRPKAASKNKEDEYSQSEDTKQTNEKQQTNIMAKKPLQANTSGASIEDKTISKAKQTVTKIERIPMELDQDKRDKEKQLLTEIMAETWFNMTGVAMEKQRVTIALTQLMERTNNEDDHGKMCKRIVDIKEQLTFNVSLEKNVKKLLKNQLQHIINTWFKLKPKSENLENIKHMLQVKGSNIIELMKELGMDIGNLKMKWQEIIEQCENEIAKEISHDVPDNLTGQGNLEERLSTNNESTGDIQATTTVTVHPEVDNKNVNGDSENTKSVTIIEGKIDSTSKLDKTLQKTHKLNTLQDVQLRLEEQDSPELSLLKEIVSELWFTIDNVQLEKESVTIAVTTLMEQCTVATDHERMCYRIVDIKQQLDYSPNFLQQLANILTNQLANITDKCYKFVNSTRPTSGKRQHLLRKKGANIIELLELLNCNIDETKKKWDDLENQIIMALKRQTPVATKQHELLSEKHLVESLTELHSQQDSKAESSESHLESEKTNGEETTFDINMTTKRNELSTANLNKMIPTQDSGYGSLQDTRESSMVNPNATDYYNSSNLSGNTTSIKIQMSSHHSDSGIGTEIGSVSDELQEETVIEHLTALTEETHSNSERATTAASGPQSNFSEHGNQEIEDNMLPQVLRPYSAVSHPKSKSTDPHASATSTRIQSAHSALQTSRETTFSPPKSALSVKKINEPEKSIEEENFLPDIGQFMKKHNLKNNNVFEMLDDHKLVRMLQNLPKIVYCYQTPKVSKNTVVCSKVVEKLPSIYKGNKQYLPGNDNTIFGLSDADKNRNAKGRQALLISLQQQDNSIMTQVKAREKKRVTIMSPVQIISPKNVVETFTRSRTEPRMYSSGVGRPSYVSAADWTKISGSQPSDSSLPNVQSLWPDHCRMEQLAKRGLHKPGISISKHLDRYALIETIARGVSGTMRLQAQFHNAQQSPIQS